MLIFRQISTQATFIYSINEFILEINMQYENKLTKYQKRDLFCLNHEKILLGSTIWHQALDQLDSFQADN